ncbi:molecular chaperone (DnaJ family), putative [Theileria annulata]|uniref:Molecular chaperone (DnaJ family), putative n=1 Tax=Theileria annulata TaxID=5874 RepID=Q4U8Z7_THEAN|nr:molecular chaperone (DnaJ family), putative [Theileria annulata]CAI76706.1 molecular chaperone (DnaJ family), putative [Theileria annulata]|eukprot:XP_953331.1 molecular chaperone (DnaJ family), putative [Theileria annulata]
MYISFHLCIAVLCSFYISESRQDYYSILGVRKNATDREIEKAFRKKAKKLHPDANPGNEKAFSELSNAYEVLKDPSKRKTYDMYGEEGLKQEGPQGHPYQHYYGEGGHTFFSFEGFDFDDVFAHFNFGGGHKGNKREQQFQSSISFENTIVEEICPKNYNNTVKNIRVLNLYYFFMSNSRTCQSAQKGFVDTITKFKGALNVYAINCDKHSNFCNKNVRSVPHLIAYNNTSPDPIVFENEDYTLKLEIWLHKIMPSELVEIKDYKHLKDFIENQPITHVIYIFM